MRYYERHEEEYQKRLAAGQVAWDKGEYADFEMRPLVERLLIESRISGASCTALDLGCGTGALACLLASRGFAVTAIDVAESAIAEAKKQAAQRGLAIDFRVADVCRGELPASSFDLITDNHFLHCVVYSTERQFVLLNIRRALKSQGEFWTETMVGHPDMVPSPEWNMDEQGITWCEIPLENKTDGCIECDGRMWLPVRRILLSDQVVMSELREAGFETLWHETEPPSGKGETATFRARCRGASQKKVTPGRCKGCSAGELHYCGKVKR